MGYRDARFKFIFAAQYATGMAVWRMPLTTLRAPLLIDLLSDPYEYSIDGSAYYEEWMLKRTFLVLPAVQKVSKYLATYKDFPPRQRPASFSIDQVLEKLNASISSR